VGFCHWRMDENEEGLEGGGKSKEGFWNELVWHEIWGQLFFGGGGLNIGLMWNLSGIGD